MALSADTTRKFASGIDPIIHDMPVKASSTIYAGAALCSEADGYARAVAASLTSPKFLGFAERAQASVGSNGAATVRVRMQGIVYVSAITGLSGIGDVGTAVYMSDDTTFTNSSTNNVLVGEVISYDATDKFGVRFTSTLLA